MHTLGGPEFPCRMYHSLSYVCILHPTPHPPGVALGILTGMRGLCMGLGPALYGILFYMFHVDLGDSKTPTNQTNPVIPRVSGTCTSITRAIRTYIVCTYIHVCEQVHTTHIHT